MGTVKKLSPELYTAVIDEAHKNKLRVIAHIYTLEDAKATLRAGLDAFAHGVRDKDLDDEFIALVKQQPNLVLGPNMPDRGVVARHRLAEAEPAGGGIRALQKNNTNRPEAQTFWGIQARNLAKMNAAGVNIVAWNRRQYAVRAACRDGRHGRSRNDPDAGDRGLHAQRRAVSENERRRHDRSEQERRLHRPRCEPSGRHHQHAEDCIRVSSGRLSGPLGVQVVVRVAEV